MNPTRIHRPRPPRRLLAVLAATVALMAVLTGCNQLREVAGLGAGTGFTCALRDDGTIDCWGENTYGQLGVGDVERRYVPTEVPVP